MTSEPTEVEAGTRELPGTGWPARQPSIGGTLFPDAGSTPPEPLDLRLAPAALATWGAAALGLGWTPAQALAGAALLLVAGVTLLWWSKRQASLPRERSRSEGSALLVAAAVLLAAGALATAGLRAGAVLSGPLPDLAAHNAYVDVTGVVTSDPVRKEGQFAPYVIVRLRVVTVAMHGTVTAVRSPLLVIGSEAWQQVRFGDLLEGAGRLQVSRGPDLAGVLIATRSPTVTRGAGPVSRGIAEVRAGLVEAASVLPAAERSLVPALVDGDDSAMPPEVTADFKTTGLTHLLAVSGSNLTLVLAFALLVARWCRVRSHALTLVGACTVVFFVLLARPEPSVLRAAAMGLVALAGLSTGGRRRGVRVLCVAVTVLLLLDPWLARSVGFLLSTLATAGILLLAPPWRDALTGWLPRPVAEALAVPMAAQIVCTPAIAAISGQVSVVAVLANLAAAPAVGPTTVLGLVAGLAAIVSPIAGHVLGHLAGLTARWIVTVATSGAQLAGASVSWPVGPTAIAALAALCIAIVAVMQPLLRRRYASLAVAALLVVAVLRPGGRLGWPPHGWLLVACDVGQGDGLVLNAGSGVAVVVDTGPDPRLMDRCLDRLEIHKVALVVLTHFHADHVDGLPGVLADRVVAEIETSPLREPADRADAVTEEANAAAVPTTTAVLGEQRTIGQLSWQVLGPVDVSSADSGAGSEEGSGPNNASVVMLVQVQGHRLLLSGDAEPAEELDLLAASTDLSVDVFKVAHHGSANQEPNFVFATSAPLALISVGKDNGYGHPASATLGLLAQMGAQVYRTDLDGDIAVIDSAGQLAVVTSK